MTGKAKSPFLLCLGLLLLLPLTNAETGRLTTCQKTWCVAKPSTDETALDNNIQFACSATSGCGIIQKGGPCFYPYTNISHASVAMNLYYQSKGRNPWNCYFNASGLIVLIDPSYNSCKYA